MYWNQNAFLLQGNPQNNDHIPDFWNSFTQQTTQRDQTQRHLNKAIEDMREQKTKAQEQNKKL